MSCKRRNEQVKKDGGEPATGEEVILGITKASLATDSFLIGRLVPGDDQGADRRRARGQDATACSASRRT